MDKEELLGRMIFEGRRHEILAGVYEEWAFFFRCSYNPEIIESRSWLLELEKDQHGRASKNGRIY